jgi:hypothetical protein
MKHTLSQFLARGTPVIIADSFGKPKLRGAKMMVASKSTVKCNKKGRCAGNWCLGLSAFVADPDTVNDEKDMGWRQGTTKVCLTHLKDKDGNLVLPPPPPAMRVAQDAIEKAQAPRPVRSEAGPVSWDELAHTVADKDLPHLAFLARRLKTENDDLQRKVLVLQEKVIAQLTVG